MADPIQFLHRQRRQEGFLFAGSHDAKPARAFQPRRDGRHHFRARRAYRNAQPRALQNLHLQPPQRSRKIRIQPLGPCKVQIKIVQRRGFHRRRIRFQNPPHAFGKIRVVLVLPRHHDGFRADAQRFAKTHRRAHAAKFCFVARRSHAAAPHQHGLPAQAGIQHLLHRREKRVHIHVHDVGSFGIRIFAQTQPRPARPRISLRCRFPRWRFRGTRSAGIPCFTFLPRLRLLRPAMRVGGSSAVFFHRGCRTRRFVGVRGFEGWSRKYAFDTVDRFAVTRDNVHGGS